jgi:aspartyl-tRNA(Asn)/glutamyl-tRNA(Gln) amidotransferase subunit C
LAIDRAQVRHVARLARLALSEEEEEKLAAQLGHVLEYVERLQGVDVSGVEPLSFAGDTQSQEPMREDVARPGLPTQTVLAQAPDRDANAFKVPRILE